MPEWNAVLRRWVATEMEQGTILERTRQAARDYLGPVPLREDVNSLSSILNRRVYGEYVNFVRQGQPPTGQRLREAAAIGVRVHTEVDVPRFAITPQDIEELDTARAARRLRARLDEDRAPPQPAAVPDRPLFDLARANAIRGGRVDARAKPALKVEHTATTTVNTAFLSRPKEEFPRQQREAMLLSLPGEDFPYDHCVGLEIEVENFKVPPTNRELAALLNEGFTAKADGSLRQGIEYVTKYGLTAADALAYMRVLDGGMKSMKGGNDFSHRCGLHVHVDAHEHTLDELYRVALLYSVVEQILFAVSGGRNTNKFCVAVDGSVSAVEGILHYGHSGQWPKLADAVWNGSKYMAMNIKTLRQFGTVEFRHHRGTSDPDVIRKWLLILLDLMLGVKKVPTKTLEDRIVALNTNSEYAAFVRDMFPNSHTLLTIPSFEKLMYPGVSFVKHAFVTDPDDLSGNRE
jgi:hypothetical protein